MPTSRRSGEKLMPEFPYIRMYPKDILADEKVILMDLDAFGAYVRLLFIAWHSTPPASLPSDDSAIAKLLGVSTERWTQLRPTVLPCWTIQGRRMYQKR